LNETNTNNNDDDDDDDGNASNSTMLLGKPKFKSFVSHNKAFPQRRTVSFYCFYSHQLELITSIQRVLN